MDFLTLIGKLEYNKKVLFRKNNYLLNISKKWAVSVILFFETVAT